MQISAAVCVSAVLVPRLAAAPRVALGAAAAAIAVAAVKPPVRAGVPLASTDWGIGILFIICNGAWT